MNRRKRKPPYTGNELNLGVAEDGSKVVLTGGARSGHLYMSGLTDCGKSRAIQSYIRQDIANWKQSESGLLLLDPHGEIFNALVAWLARTPRYKRLPIVLIDLSRDDRLVGYSPLRMRAGVSPAVAASQFVDAVLHAFGQLDPTATPTITRVLSTITQTLLVTGMPLPQVFDLLDPERGDHRAAVLAKIDDAVTRSDLERLHRLTKPRFEDEVIGPINRLSAFLKNPLLRTILGQSRDGFNFDWAIEQGAIVLVSLASRGSKITANDAKLFASLMLTDLWQAAMARGKRKAGGVKPFYIYIDEASTLCTPTIAQNLDQARGFGLHFTLVTQMLSQFESYGGAFGRAIRKSVIANTLNKICFRQSTDEDDLIPLVRALFLGQFDANKKKHELTSIQTVGYDEEERWTKSESVSEGQSEGESIGETRSDSWSETNTSSTSCGSTGSESVSESRTTGTSFPEGGVGAGSVTDGESSSDGWSQTESTGSSSQIGGSESVTYGVSTQRSQSVSNGRQQEFVQRPILEERVSSIQYYSLPEQLMGFEQALTGLAKREGIVSCDGWTAPKKMRTLDVIDPYVRPEWIEKFRDETMIQHAFWLTREEALARLAPPPRIATAPLALKSYGRRRESVPPALSAIEEGEE